MHFDAAFFRRSCSAETRQLWTSPFMHCIVVHLACGVGVHGQEIVRLKLGMVGENLPLRCAAGEPLQDFLKP